MANVVTIQNKVYYGYSKAAAKLGLTFNQYRSSSAINPIQSGNFLRTILASNSVNWAYDKANKYGNAIWNCLIDGRLTQVGDYIVGTRDTFFIAAMQSIMPILAVECNRTITITRTIQLGDQQAGTTPTTGYVGYVGRNINNSNSEKIIMQNIPCSILEGSRGQFNKVGLPTDTKMPEWKILLPRLGGVLVGTGDFILDDLGGRYTVISDEDTDFGWRLTAVEEGA